MKVIICKNYDEMSQTAAEIVAKQINSNPHTVLGLATGSTPVGMYKTLVKMYKEGKVDFSNVVTFNLDEYVGLDKDHPCSYHRFMDENLFNHINIKRENVHLPNGVAPSLEEECKAYEKMIAKAGGITLQVLGIGHNGHIGFNEPGTPFHSLTHVVELAQRTIEANSRFFNSPDEVPRKAISMGIKTIMQAQKILLLASGKD
ncbi:MAG: glucosamine-6-phosphate deaminase, partial [Caldicoprobacter sp.]|uniref:glucosamine-6-phosphate deaminase n=1 Tax=Caldicoprobacter sp. TaxID=2004500 RepID=UPI0039C0DCC8